MYPLNHHFISNLKRKNLFILKQFDDVGSLPSRCNLKFCAGFYLGNDCRFKQRTFPNHIEQAFENGFHCVKMPKQTIQSIL